MPLRVPKNLVKKVCKKSIVLLNGKRIRTKLIVNDFSYWLILK